MKYGMTIFLMILFLVLPETVLAAPEQPAVGMTAEEVERLWGSHAGTDSYSGNLRWYQSDGYTLVCAYDWCDPEWTKWGMAEWIVFDRAGKRTGGNVPEGDTAFRAVFEIGLSNPDKFSSIPNVHNIGSGSYIPAKITSDGWIVEYDLGPRPIPCLGQPGVIVWLLSFAGLLLGLRMVVLVIMLILGTAAAISILIRRNKHRSRA